ncbi:MAG: hypothetical protein JW757_00845 [Anaerolineales bacterium]|nr:hypothetical protein [Anaerolineales bacterium]
MRKFFLIVMVFLFLLSGCNYPTPAENSDVEETSAAQTTEADDAVTATDDDLKPTEGLEEDVTPEPSPTEEPGAEEATRTPESGDGEQIGEGDFAEFIADVTIPDYSEVLVGEEITKTWRIKNAGTTTWTTDYVLEFEKGEKLGASTQIPLEKEVAPGETIDISIDFKVPTATGEYTSYWILKNEDNQRVGAGDEGEYLSLYMIILAVKEEDGGGDDGDDENGGSSSGGQSISGGAKVTGATVSMSNTNYSGECPPQLTINYTVTTSNAGKVQFNLLFNVISPSGFKFDAPPEYLVNFSSGYTVYYDYLLMPSNSVTATVRVQAIGENEFLSEPVQFSVKCQ